VVKDYTTVDGVLRHYIVINSSNNSRNMLEIMKRYAVSVPRISKIYDNHYAAVAETPTCMLYSLLVSSKCFLESEYCSSGSNLMRWQIICPSRKKLQSFTAELQRNGIYYRLVSVNRLRHGPATLTRKQTALLKTAVETGYFETPKTATTKALAEKLRTSPSAISETMRRALKKIVTHYLEGTP
jgi:predicted DNA binding protein